MRFIRVSAAAPVCSPTWTSILTGKYPTRIGITDCIDWFDSTHPARGRVMDASYLKSLPLEVNVGGSYADLPDRREDFWAWTIPRLENPNVLEEVHAKLASPNPDWRPPTAIRMGGA